MIKNNLHLLLKERKITATKVYEDTGIAHTTLSRMKLNTLNGIDYKTLNTLCKYLNCRVEDILKYEKDKK